MMNQILPIIRDPEDYITALSLYKADAMLTREDADKLLAIYAKYAAEIEATMDLGDLKICLAVDLLKGRGEEDAADFAALELGGETLDALFTAKKLVKGREKITADAAEKIVALASDKTIQLPVRIMLARIALDCMAGAGNFAELQPQVRTLAAILTEVGSETMARYTDFVMEAMMICRI